MTKSISSSIFLSNQKCHFDNFLSSDFDWSLILLIELAQNLYLSSLYLWSLWPKSNLLTLKEEPQITNAQLSDKITYIVYIPPRLPCGKSVPGGQDRRAVPWKEEPLPDGLEKDPPGQLAKVHAADQLLVHLAEGLVQEVQKEFCVPKVSKAQTDGAGCSLEFQILAPQ